MYFDCLIVGASLTAGQTHAALA